MDVLPSGGIFRELQAVHDTGYFSGQASLEEDWQQVFCIFCIFANLPIGASMVCNWVSVEAWERERGREIPAYSIFGRISSPINCILIVRIKANFSVVRGLINFAPEDNGCQEMCRLTKFLEKARHLLAVQPILPKSLRRTLFFRGEFLTAPPKHEENLFMLSFTLD